MEPSFNLSPGKLRHSLSSRIPSLHGHPACEMVSCLEKLGILNWGTPAFLTGSSMARKCASFATHTLNNWLAAEIGTLRCLLLTLICLKLLLLMEAPGRRQLTYKKHPGGCMDTCTQFQNFAVFVEAYWIYCLLQYSPQWDIVWSPFPSPGDLLPNPRIESMSPALQANSLPLSHLRRPDPTVSRPSLPVYHGIGPWCTYPISTVPPALQ